MLQLNILLMRNCNLAPGRKMADLSLAVLAIPKNEKLLTEAKYRELRTKQVSPDTAKNCSKERLEWFSFECRKVIDFAFATLHDWLKKFAPIFHPVRSKAKTNRDSFARVFSRFASATCNYL